MLAAARGANVPRAGVFFGMSRSSRHLHRQPRAIPSLRQRSRSIQAWGVFRRAVACDSAQRIVSCNACHRSAGSQARSRRSCSQATRSAGSSSKLSPFAFVMAGGLVASVSTSHVASSRPASAGAGLPAGPTGRQSYPRHKVHGTQRGLRSAQSRPVPDRPPTMAGR